MHYRTGVEIHQTQVTVVMLKRNSTNALCHSSHAFFFSIDQKDWQDIKKKKQKTEREAFQKYAVD